MNNGSEQPLAMKKVTLIVSLKRRSKDTGLLGYPFFSESSMLREG